MPARRYLTTMTMTTLITSVSETIRNLAPLAEAKTTGILEKQKKYVLWNAGICPIPKLCFKKLLPYA